MSRFDSVLVANRGEIAVRVLRTAKAQGYRTIAVYSEADADAPHVAMADNAVLIGAAPVKESYLNASKILQAAQQTAAQAIHPGYGFLSENADFAKACEKAGIVFIGPHSDAIALMGNKAASKRRMLEAGVPCIPGYQAEDQSDDALLAAAHNIGVPIMVKAAAGGGGRGMRLVDNLAQLEDALASARSEAQNAFGSSELILEKALLQPRHVEIQVFGDEHGNVIHLGERDCSVQRRHQKVVEEAPCPVMNDDLREAMGKAAVDAARSIDYVGAGTVEFLLDTDGKFYFLEMNTRLQVEHPVTEMISGQDLVAWQLAVAQGEPLPISQSELQLNGHAIEVRLYAEDTEQNFLPASGTAEQWLLPYSDRVRVDHGLKVGQSISPFYDPMVAKVIAWGENRDQARRRLISALKETILLGFASNRAFLIDVLKQPLFANGDFSTAFIEQLYANGFGNPPPTDQHLLLAALALDSETRKREANKQVFKQPVGHGGALASNYVFAGQSVSLQWLTDVTAKAILNQQLFDLHLHEHDERGFMRVSIDQLSWHCFVQSIGDAEVAVQIDGVLCVLEDQQRKKVNQAQQAGSGDIVAPMHGTVVEVVVSKGQQVTAGQKLAVMEAMKMEHQLNADIDGVVIEINARPGQQYSAGEALIRIEKSDY